MQSPNYLNYLPYPIDDKMVLMKTDFLANVFAWNK